MKLYFLLPGKIQSSHFHRHHSFFKLSLLIFLHSPLERPQTQHILLLHSVNNHRRPFILSQPKHTNSDNNATSYTSRWILSHTFLSVSYYALSLLFSAHFRSHDIHLVSLFHWLITILSRLFSHLLSVFFALLLSLLPFSLPFSISLILSVITSSSPSHTSTTPFESTLTYERTLWSWPAYIVLSIHINTYNNHTYHLIHTCTISCT